MHLPPHDTFIVYYIPLLLIDNKQSNSNTGKSPPRNALYSILYVYIQYMYVQESINNVYVTPIIKAIEIYIIKNNAEINCLLLYS